MLTQETGQLPISWPQRMAADVDKLAEAIQLDPLDTNTISQVGRATQRMSDLRKRMVIRTERVSSKFCRYHFVRWLTEEEIAEKKQGKKNARLFVQENSLPIANIPVGNYSGFSITVIDGRKYLQTKGKGSYLVG